MPMRDWDLIPVGQTRWGFVFSYYEALWKFCKEKVQELEGNAEVDQRWLMEGLERGCSVPVALEKLHHVPTCSLGWLSKDEGACRRGRP